MPAGVPTRHFCAGPMYSGAMPVASRHWRSDRCTIEQAIEHSYTAHAELAAIPSLSPCLCANMGLLGPDSRPTDRQQPGRCAVAFCADLKWLVQKLVHASAKQVVCSCRVPAPRPSCVLSSSAAIGLRVSWKLRSSATRLCSCTTFVPGPQTGLHKLLGRPSGSS